jgi:hypothetical protein
MIRNYTRFVNSAPVIEEADMRQPTPEELETRQRVIAECAERNRLNAAVEAANAAAEWNALPESQKHQLASESAARAAAIESETKYRAGRTRYALRHGSVTEGVEWFTSDEASAANRALQQASLSSRWESC